MDLQLQSRASEEDGDHHVTIRDEDLEPEDDHHTHHSIKSPTSAEPVSKTPRRVCCSVFNRLSIQSTKYACHHRKLWLVPFLFLCLGVATETLPFLSGGVTPLTHTLARFLILYVCHQLAAVTVCKWRQQVSCSDSAERSSICGQAVCACRRVGDSFLARGVHGDRGRLFFTMV